MSAPMLSQVERGETSPTISAATKIAAGLDLSLSQLLRLDESGHVVIVRARARAKASPRRPSRRGAHPAAARASARTSPAIASTRAPQRAGPMIRRSTNRGAGRPPWCSRGRPPWSPTATVTSCSTGDSVTFDADLPHHFENNGEQPRRAARRRGRRPEEKLMPKTMFDKIWEAHEVAEGLIYVDLHLVHEVTSPQAFDGLRLEGRQGSQAGQDGGHRRPQRPDGRHPDRPPDRRRAVAGAGRDAGAKLRRVRNPDLLPGVRPTGHRARDRSGARALPAGPCDRLRGQPHVHSRRVRRGGHGDRDIGGRARARHSVPGPEATEDDADQLRRGISAPGSARRT